MRQPDINQPGFAVLQAQRRASRRPAMTTNQLRRYQGYNRILMFLKRFHL